MFCKCNLVCSTGHWKVQLLSAPISNMRFLCTSSLCMKITQLRVFTYKKPTIPFFKTTDHSQYTELSYLQGNYSFIADTKYCISGVSRYRPRMATASSEADWSCLQRKTYFIEWSERASTAICRNYISAEYDYLMKMMYYSEDILRRYTSINCQPLISSIIRCLQMILA